jgi:hypothetical protein
VLGGGADYMNMMNILQSAANGLEGGEYKEFINTLISTTAAIA